MVTDPSLAFDDDLLNIPYDQLFTPMTSLKAMKRFEVSKMNSRLKNEDDHHYYFDRTLNGQ